MSELESELFGSGGLPCWRPGGIRSIASSWLMMLSGTLDGKGSGTGESLAEMSGLLGCLLGCLLNCPLARREVNIEWVICIYRVEIRIYC